LYEVLGVIRDTTTAGTSDNGEFESCVGFCASELTQAALRATTVARFRWSPKLVRLFRALGRLAPIRLPSSLSTAKRLSQELFYTDFGTRPYREAWLNGAARKVAN